jgi:short subunit dehydrogenase-like uncharacterized protein
VIVLYGATGYTGGLIADELTSAGLTFTLAGRDATRLAALSQQRGGIPWAAASVDDPAGLRALLADARVVINCAGPFTLSGDGLLEAAIETRTHYLDTASEQLFLRKVFEERSPAAQERGVALVPGLGFGVVGDLLGHLVAREREPLASLEIGYWTVNQAMGRGMALTVLEVLRERDLVYENGALSFGRRGVQLNSFEFPAPIGKQPVIRFPSCEVITVPRHTQTRAVRVVQAAAGLAPTPALARFVQLGLPVGQAVLRTPIYRLAQRAASRSAAGPTEQQREAAEFTVHVVAHSDTGAVAIATARGRDPYRVTAAGLTQAARHMSEPAYSRAGALAPAAAFDPEALLRALEPAGLSWSVGSR